MCTTCSTQGVPRMLFGELQRADNSAPKRLAQTLLREHGQCLHRLIEQVSAQGSVAADIDVQPRCCCSSAACKGW